MAYFDAYFDETENENEENEFDFKTGLFKDSTIFLVDCTKSMFKKYSDECTYFEKCLKAIQNMYQHKIYGSDKDLLSVVFFGTEFKNNCNDFSNIYVLQELDQPNAERIKQIEMFTKEFDCDHFKHKYGHSDDFSLEDVLWCCSNMFSTIKQKLDIKRIMLFTRNDHPHSNSKTLERLAKNRAKDLQDIGIALELIPVISEGEHFDYSKFYADLLMLSADQLRFLGNPIEEFKELEKTIRSKDHKKRPYTHLKLKLSNDLALSCSIYNIIRPCAKPVKVKLDKATNVETKLVTKRFNKDTGEILFASDIKLAVNLASNKRVLFEQEEVKLVKRFDAPGMNLLGFKSIDLLKPYFYVKPGHFLYPDENHIEGSTKLFRALLEKCVEKKKFVLCEIIPRVNTPPRLVALVPQVEELDKHTNVQLAPPGFHIIYLPYADDFRCIDKKVDCKATDEQIDAFKVCIKKLRYPHNPENFKNPSIQKIWNEIEAIALEREEPEQVVDLTLPDLERIKARVGQCLDEFKQACGLDNSSLSTATKRKSKVNNDKASKNPKISSQADLSEDAEAGRLTNYTVAQLREFAKSLSLKVNGTKKQDYIDAINKFYQI